MAKARRPRSHPTFNRVYFVGAGFSAGMHYPVGQSLMSRLVAYLRNEDDDIDNSVHDAEMGPEHASKMIRVIERVLDTYFAVKLSGIGRVDVAEFFTLAQTLSERPWLGGGRYLVQ